VFVLLMGVGVVPGVMDDWFGCQASLACTYEWGWSTDLYQHYFRDLGIYAK